MQKIEEEIMESTVDIDINKKIPKYTENIDIEKWKLLLKSLSFFKVFSDEELEEIMRVSELRKYELLERIITEGRLCDAIYIILKGRAIVEKKTKSKQAKLSVRVLEKGSCFGEAGLLLKESRSATVKANSDVYAIRVTEKHIENFHPETKAKFFRQLSLDLSKRLLVSSEKIVG
jgi:CRP-like cAMP-binding protein|tara:strand:+ start:2125 stop:2649 length:525 start_codon:yes stop_codon:yes gene_type:complete